MMVSAGVWNTAAPLYGTYLIYSIHPSIHPSIEYSRIVAVIPLSFSFGAHVLSPMVGEHITPTCHHIKEALQWLCEGAGAGDNLFMHYSGHGGSTPDNDGDEEDGMDETLVPVDYQRKGQIRDDDLFDLLVSHVPEGCNLTVVMDCCHSGTILDLPYTLKVDKGTLEAIASGHPPTTKPNPKFTGRLLKLGIALLKQSMRGASIGQLRKAAIRSMKH